MDDDDNYQPADGDKKKMTDQERTAAKYAGETAGFSLKGSAMQDGLVKDRGCTDPLCLILFLAFVVSMGYLGYYGHANGDVERLIAPVDAALNLCGITPGYEGYKKLYITDFSSPNINTIFASAVCVKACPTEVPFELDCVPNAKVPSCTLAAGAEYKTRAVLDYCFPASTDELPDSFKAGWELAFNTFKSSEAGQFFNDMYLSSRAIYLSIFMSVVYAFLFIGLMSAFAEPIAWLCIVTIQLGLLGAAGGCAYLYKVNMDEYALDPNFTAA